MKFFLTFSVDVAAEAEHLARDDIKSQLNTKMVLSRVSMIYLLEENVFEPVSLVMIVIFDDYRTRFKARVFLI